MRRHRLDAIERERHGDASRQGGMRLRLLVHHTDAKYEYAYDRDTFVGRLDKVLDVAAANQWIVADMKNDWKRIFAFE